MCLPAAAVGLLSTGLSVAGTLMESSNAQAMHSYNRKVAAQEAAQQREVGEIQAGQTRSAISRDIARQRAAIVRAGISLTSPTAIDLGADAKNAQEMHVQGIRSSAEARARGLDAESRLSELRERSARISGFGRAGGILLRNAGSWRNAGGSLLPSVGTAKSESWF